MPGAGRDNQHRPKTVLNSTDPKLSKRIINNMKSFTFGVTPGAGREQPTQNQNDAKAF